MSQTHRNYQPEIYSQGATSGVTPAVAIDPRQLEEQAKTALGVRSFNYIAGGAREKARMYRIEVPEMLTQMENQHISDLSVEKYSNPLLVTSVGLQSIVYEDKEIGPAEACGKIGSRLYWPVDDITTSSLTRAKDNGFSILIITLDTRSLAWRPADVDNAYAPFIKAMRNEIGFTDPVFRAKFEKESGWRIEEDILGLGFLGKNWDGPLLLKGIQHVGDAKPAVEAGCDGMVVSDHGDSIKIVIRGLLADVWQNMGLLGIRSVTERYRDRIRKVVYPGDRHAMM
ncbi:FMN-linked oxidoreductase [Aspergillus brunneoviolaceus CBS 621.78]|uniref:FMN-linked oxidoreductase n=1 Tax=Aspergillus brunneoviolaceus CBS 621.78 TaxID=1450534 RepID=A0ACD1G0Y2_9EURO|nr:FMN-linked oxidoreductase [Aspergillus brunneoviolaceus CBS 621.78]RAH42894.1 FMN-linked oxidoreductase [Aspergillus brunneoviolaceus CBS 621.78]